MKIDVPSIPPEGQTIDFDQGTPWFSHLLKDRLGEKYVKSSQAQGHLDLLRTNQNVTCNGSVEMSLAPECSRCGQGFETQLRVPILRHMVPHKALERETVVEDEEGIELCEEDLAFSSYHNEEIDLAQLVVEEIQLALPLRFLCNEQCKGLCPRCGINLNESTCRCARLPEDSPFAALQGMKLKS